MAMRDGNTAVGIKCVARVPLRLPDVSVSNNTFIAPAPAEWTALTSSEATHPACVLGRHPRVCSLRYWLSG